MDKQPEDDFDLDAWAEIWGDIASERSASVAPSDTGHSYGQSANIDSILDSMFGPEDNSGGGDDQSYDNADQEYEEAGMLMDHVQADDPYYIYMETIGAMNPIPSDTKGKDQSAPKPAWVREDLLTQIEKMRGQLDELEIEASKFGQGKKFSEKAMEMDDSGWDSKIRSLRDKIDRVSDRLGLGDEPQAPARKGRR